MKNLLILIFTICLFGLTNAQQKYFSKNTNVSFDATAKSSPEDIKGKTSKAVCIIDFDKATTEVSMLVKTFHFEKALMEEHFNENYIESDKFPKANFKGTFSDLKNVNLAKDGDYTANVSGDITIHGVTKPLTTKVTFTVKAGVPVKVSGKFSVKLDDFKVAIPAAVKDKVAQSAELNISADLAAYK